MKIKYVEGTWFAVPLRSAGFAVGIVSRATRRGPHILAHFFGPKRSSIPSLEDLSALTASAAIKVARTGDLQLLDGSWPIIGRATEFQRINWQFPKFVRTDILMPRAWIIEYADDDPGREIRMTPIAHGTSALDRDASFGTGAIEIVLTKMLG